VSGPPSLAVHTRAVTGRARTDAPQQPPGVRWNDYVAWLVETHGSLAAVADKLASRRAWADDSASIERALRRLRTREHLDGGTWGVRCLAAFGLPGALRDRVRWLGAYHSRFTDLPVPLCEDLLRVWDRPPVSEAPDAQAWLALAHASCALRSARPADAAGHLLRARAVVKRCPAEARVELLLTEAFVASRDAHDRVEALLVEAVATLDEVEASDDRACLRARLVDQEAWQWNKGRRGPADPRAAEALYRTLVDEGAPPFARCRRASGLAYCAWRLGRADEAITLARAAVDHAGDGGHLRLRAMSLQMVARVGHGDEAKAASERARAIAHQLDDEALKLRFEHAPKTR
jgi:hypothetical protein